MPHLENFLTSSWYTFMNEDQRVLTKDALALFAREEREHTSFHDFAFIVFPLAKAYEGFLKLYFVKTGLITDKMYQSRKFRIGRSLNPDIPGPQRNEEWIYDDVVYHCGDDTARLLWKAWVEGRNLLFHEFPDHRHCLLLEDAESRLQLVADAMESAMSCYNRAIKRMKQRGKI